MFFINFIDATPGICSSQAPAFSMWELYFIHYQPFKHINMKILFKSLTFVIVLTLLFTACSGPNKIKCPSDTSWETSRRHNLR